MIDEDSFTPAGIGMEEKKAPNIFSLIAPIILFCGLMGFFGFLFVNSDSQIYFYLMGFFGMLGLLFCMIALLKSPKSNVV